MKRLNVFRSIVFRTPATRWLLLVNILALISFIGYVLLNVKARDLAVPLRYSTINEVVAKGQWYQYYFTILFAVAAFWINSWLTRFTLEHESVDMNRLAPKIMIFNLTLLALLGVVMQFLFRAGLT